MLQHHRARRSVTEPPVHLRTDITEADLERLVQLHGDLYEREFGWSRDFEDYVRAGVEAFAAGPPGERERVWIAEVGDELVGAIAIVESSAEDAQVRWFLLAPAARGRGLGKRLLEEALGFARAAEYRRVFLWTVAELEAAAALYRAAGFFLTEEITHEVWGAERTEHRYDLAF